MFCFVSIELLMCCHCVSGLVSSLFTVATLRRELVGLFEGWINN